MYFKSLLLLPCQENQETCASVILSLYNKQELVLELHAR